MPQITINVPVVEVQNPTPVTAQDLVVSGFGEVGVQVPTITNDGNVVKTLQYAITNVSGGTFVATAIEKESVTYGNASGSVSVNPGQNVKLKFFFNVAQGAPGVSVTPCTASYTVQWA